MEIIDFGEVTRGDTWDGAEITLTETDDTGAQVAINLTGALVRCHFYMASNVGAGPVIKFSSETGGGIGLTAPLTGTFNILPISRVALQPGQLIGDLEITDAVGKRLTYSNTRWLIKPDYTK